jgi:membrane protease subunit HflC
MNKAVAIFVGVLLLVVLVLFTTSYTVSFHEIAIRTRFGQADSASVITEPGLHFKLPFFADRVTKYDTRLQLLETPLEQIQTADKQPLVVTAFVMWQINTDQSNGPLDFSKNYRSVEDASGYLLNQFRDRLAVLGRYRFDELIGKNNKLQDAEQALLAELKRTLPAGVVPQAVGISQLVLPPKTSTAVLGRMKSTITVQAEEERARGMSEHQRIIADANSKADKLTAFARQRADEIRAQGSEQAAQYLAQMQEHADFAMFLTWLTALEDMLKENSTFFLQTANEPFHLLDPNAKRTAEGIPMPKRPLLGDADEGVLSSKDGAKKTDDADDEEEKPSTDASFSMSEPRS